MSDPNLPFAPPSDLSPLPPASPVWQAPPRKRPWLPWVIVLGILLVIALLASALGAVVNGLSSRHTPKGEPLVVGEPNFPQTPVLLDCDVCFDEADIPATVLDNSTVETLGLSKHDFPYGTYDATTPDELYRSVTASWAANDGEPNACVFALGNAPAVVNLVSDSGLTDTIEYTGEHASADITSTLDQSVRIFTDHAYAMGYTEKLYYQVEGCQELTIGPPGERYSATITPAPALSLPDDIEMIGWVRTGDPGPRWRAYVCDLRRGNMVVRTRLLTDGSITEEDYRAFIEDYALQLEAIEPDLIGP